VPLSAAAAKASEEVAVSFAVTVEIFVLLELLLELGFNDVDSGVHIESAFFDDDSLVWQIQSHFATAVIVVLGLLVFLEVNFGVGTLPVVARNVAVQAAQLARYVSPQFVVNQRVHTLNFEFLYHTPIIRRVSNLDLLTAAHVRLQHLWYTQMAVLSLVMLGDGHQ
jgi:hypothetical protein